MLSAYELQNARCKCLAAMHALLTCRPGAASSKVSKGCLAAIGPSCPASRLFHCHNSCCSQAAEKLALQARWCRRYAELNYLALRCII